jgi:cytidylate kinase
MRITLSRQYAAGADVVAAAVAEELGWAVLDNELVEEVSVRCGLSPEDVRALDERIPTFIERVAQTNAMAFPDMLMPSAELSTEPEHAKLARITRGVIEELGQRERLVLVGRAAAAVLASRPDALHVRLVGSREWRIRQAIERLEIPEQDAAGVLDDRDHNRAQYHREFYGRDWDDPLLYDMVLNTERLGLEGASGIIVARARQLGW